MLKGKQQHELSCSSCGAPLHNLKMVPKARLAERPTPKHKPDRKPLKQTKRKKKKKSLFSKVLDEAWDVIEDVFD